MITKILNLATSVKREENISPLQYLKGVGPTRAAILAKMGIYSPADLITYFPRDWQDRRRRFSIREAPLGERVTLFGRLQGVRFSNLKKGLGMASSTLADNTGILKLVWFKKINYRYDVFASLREKLKIGENVMVFGLYEFGVEGKQLRVEEFAVLPTDTPTLSPEDALHLDRIVPIYPITAGISERLIRSLVAKSLQTCPALPSLAPAWSAPKYGLPEKAWALEKIHFPNTLLEKEQARRYLAFEEFLLLEVALGLVRRNIKQRLKSHSYQVRKHLLGPFREHLGFDFTSAQKRAIREIFEDMMKQFPMNRLLQGDVGSGKTLVALSAMLLAVENGGQAALMAPTEILAEQHALTFNRFLKDLGISCAVLTGRQTSAHRKSALQGIASGKISLIIGTHALIQKSVQFHKLMLVVIDEQHRFGVEHRAVLREKGDAPDVLVMTATPIPRTLALTLYGDLDVSTLDELPPGRTKIATRHLSEEESYELICKEIAQGRQAYLVFPLVEESDKVELKAVMQEAARLSRTTFRQLRVGVLHGQLPTTEKETIMGKFRRHELDLLIATSIIEVGIDIPNATLMAIQHAERFGLATLHQLRGRVGRGRFPSQCLLIADIKSPEARRRIDVMIATTDGFLLSEEDLSLRGPGEILGAMQHGLPEFKLGHLIRDAALIQEARRCAAEILHHDPQLIRSDHRPLNAALRTTYASKWSLGSTG